MTAREFNAFLKKMHSDSHAIEDIYIFYYPRIVKRISEKYGYILAEDVAQEFFLKLIQSCDKQAYVEYPTSWVYTCAENIAKRKIHCDSKYTYLLQETVAAKKDDIINKVFAEDILGFLYNQTEISNILKLTHSNVRQIHSRAIKKLKKWLKM